MKVGDYVKVPPNAGGGACGWTVKLLEISADGRFAKVAAPMRGKPYWLPISKVYEK